MRNRPQFNDLIDASGSNDSMRDYCAYDGSCGFFFQAEDGIRDLTVTGVQTCALPILEPRLKDLHERVHRGSYRAQASRRIYMQKPDGRQRPIGIAALEDKIVQQAVVTILDRKSVV